MNARALVPLDIPLLLWLRQRTQTLDSESELLHGGPLRWRWLYTALLPGSRNRVAVHPLSPWAAAGMSIDQQRRQGRLQFLTAAAPQPTPTAAAALCLWLAARAHECGLDWLRAEAPGGSAAAWCLQEVGFRPLAWQETRICLDKNLSLPDADWRPATTAAWEQVRAWRRQIVPAPLRRLEPLPAAPRGWVYAPQGEVLGYAALVHGRRGCLVRPWLRPDLRQAEAVLAGLLAALRPMCGRRPLFVQVRSDQGWLLTPLAGLTRPWRGRELVLVRETVQPVPHAALQPAEERRGAPAPSF